MQKHINKNWQTAPVAHCQPDVLHQEFNQNSLLNLVDLNLQQINQTGIQNIQIKNDITIDEAINLKMLEQEKNGVLQPTPPSIKDVLDITCKNELREINSQKNVQKQFLILQKISTKMEFQNPLILSAFLNKLKLCQYLVEGLNFDVNKRYKHEAPPILYTALNSSWETFIYLLDKGADVNVTNYQKQNMLFSATKNKNPNFLFKLIQYNIDVNCRDFQGRTPLYSAAFNGNIQAIKILVKHDADLTTQDKFGGNLYHAACIHGHQHICDYLMSQRLPILNSHNGTDPCDLIMYNSNCVKLYYRMIRYRQKQ